ncbi:MAG TPA: hypothetical protein VH083_28485 [Myxococcales bacterium]|nr:hypothetical protein [Myxococcales bacterium]
MRGPLLRIAAIAVFGLSAYGLRELADGSRPEVTSAAFEAPLFPPEVARPFSFGMRSFVADLSFLAAVQIHGGRKAAMTAAGARLEDLQLARLLDYTTELDPQFCGAYRYAGSAMPRHTIDGKATDVMATEQLLRRGVAACPGDWRVPFLLGFIDSFYLGKMGDAAEAMTAAAKLPDAPKYIGFLATRLAADAGAVDLGEKLATVMESEATEDATRAAWHERLLDLRMERHLREIEAASDKYKQRTGAAAQSIAALVSTGDLPEAPQEPHGGSYKLLPNGEAVSSAAPRLRVRGRQGTQSGLLAQ